MIVSTSQGDDAGIMSCRDLEYAERVLMLAWLGPGGRLGSFRSRIVWSLQAWAPESGCLGSGPGSASCCVWNLRQII